MTERRFLVEGPLEPGARVALCGDRLRHAKVLRLGPGDPVVLFDGRGCIADAVLESDGEARIVATRIAREVGRVVLLAGWPKSAALESVLRGATEAGASEIRLFRAVRSVVSPKQERSASRFERLARIVEEAARQSERAIVPRVTFHASLAESLVERPEQARLVALDARRGEDVETAFADATDLWLLVGPEGGLDEKEVEVVLARGGMLARARLPVLRVETAAAVLTALGVLAVTRACERAANPDAR